MAGGAGFWTPVPAGSFADVASDTVATSNATSSTSFTDLTTAGPAVTVDIGASGIVLVTVTCAHLNPGGWNGDMGFELSGANTVTADATKVVSTNRPSPGNQVSATYLLTGLAAGSTTFTAKYKVGSNTSTFWNRSLVVLAL